VRVTVRRHYACHCAHHGFRAACIFAKAELRRHSTVLYCTLLVHCLLVVYPQAAVPELLLANEAGLEMLGCTAAQLCELPWASTFEDEEGQRGASLAMMTAMQVGAPCWVPG